MNMIESVRTFIEKCPLLKEGRVNVDYLGKEPWEYTIDGVPVSTTVKQYTDGARLRRYEFVFGSREYYGTDMPERIENSAFYEDFSAWLDEMSINGQLPDLGENKWAQSIEAVSGGYIMDTDGKYARYQIQCRMIYYEGRMIA